MGKSLTIGFSWLQRTHTHQIIINLFVSLAAEIKIIEYLLGSHSSSIFSYPFSQLLHSGPIYPSYNKITMIIALQFVDVYTKQTQWSSSIVHVPGIKHSVKLVSFKWKTKFKFMSINQKKKVGLSSSKQSLVGYDY